MKYRQVTKWNIKICYRERNKIINNKYGSEEKFRRQAQYKNVC